MGKSICKGCNNKFPTEETLVIKGKKYCSTCAEQVRKQMEEEKNKAKQQKLEEAKAKKVNDELLSFICNDCGNSFSMDVAQKTKGVCRCPSCFEKWRKDVNKLHTLRDYIYEQQGKDKNKIVLAGKMIQDFVTEHGFSYNGILLTLMYFVEEKGGDISNGIGIVPYIYEEAREYFSKRNEIRKQISEITKPLVSYRVINFKSETSKPRTNLPDIKVDDIQV